MTATRDGVFVTVTEAVAATTGTVAALVAVGDCVLVPPITTVNSAEPPLVTVTLPMRVPAEASEGTTMYDDAEAVPPLSTSPKSNCSAFTNAMLVPEAVNAQFDAMMVAPTRSWKRESSVTRQLAHDVPSLLNVAVIPVHNG